MFNLITLHRYKIDYKKHVQIRFLEINSQDINNVASEEIVIKGLMSSMIQHNSNFRQSAVL